MTEGRDRGEPASEQQYEQELLGLRMPTPEILITMLQEQQRSMLEQQARQWEQQHHQQCMMMEMFQRQRDDVEACHQEMQDLRFGRGGQQKQREEVA